MTNPEALPNALANAAGPGPAGEAPATPDAGYRAASEAEGKAVVRRYFEGVLSGGDLSLTAGLFADDYVAHDPSLPPLPRARGRLPARPGLPHRLPRPAVDRGRPVRGGRPGGRAVRAPRTHLGPLLDLPPTGRRVEVSGVAIYHVAGGRIAEGWVGFDLPGLLDQLGVPARLAGAAPEDRAERTDLRALTDAPPA